MDAEQSITKMDSIPNDPGLRGILQSAKSIYLSGCAAEISEIPNLFRRYRPLSATVTGIFIPGVNRRSYADTDLGMRMRSFFINRQINNDLGTDLIDYCPWRYSTIDNWLSVPGRFDTALVMLSAPDSHGKCSLGVQADFLPSFYVHVEHIVGFINPKMPRTQGDTLIDYSSLAVAVEYDMPLLSVPTRTLDPSAIAIAGRIANLVRDNSTVQIGIGQIPSQVLAMLGNHRGIRVHSGAVDDNILLLDKSGALDREAPIITGIAIGTTNLYDALRDNSRFRFRSVSYTHAFCTISGLDQFVAINSVLQIDLLGQMSAEGSGGRLVASPGGLSEFVRGALASKDGHSIIAVRASGIAGHPGGIVPLLPSLSVVTIGASDADIIVTEFGVAQIRNLSLDGRAEAIIAIAAPEDQDRLMRAWIEVRAALLPRS